MMVSLAGFVRLSTRFLTVTLFVPLGSSALFDDRYGIYESCESWHGAVAQCLEKGGRLATIPDRRTHSLLIKLIKDQGLAFGNFWFNAHDIGPETEWQTFDGEKVKYFDWAPGEPNNGGTHESLCGWNQDCAQLWRDWNFKFDDDHCCNMKGYICEFDGQTSDTNITTLSTKITIEDEETSADYTPSPTRDDRQRLLSVCERVLQIGGGMNQTNKATDAKYSRQVSESRSSDTSNRVQLVLIVFNFLLLIANLFFGYYYVSRKIKREVISEPRYEDLMKDQYKDDTKIL
ncbi:uncharacterized protein [Ptychodera flava]|uniref:uncharacterized protein n=1 Tax=Ptychodera flava TaxID=63121 RepID=UPI003969E871